MMNELVHSKTTKLHELLLRLRSAYASAHSNQSQEAYGTWLPIERTTKADQTAGCVGTYVSCIPDKIFCDFHQC